MKTLTRSTLTLSALSLAALSLGQAHALTFTIGYQKGGIPNLLKARGTLDKYAAQGIDFKWVLFTAGPPLLEAANAGRWISAAWATRRGCSRWRAGPT